MFMTLQALTKDITRKNVKGINRVHPVNIWKSSGYLYKVNSQMCVYISFGLWLKKTVLKN